MTFFPFPGPSVIEIWPFFAETWPLRNKLVRVLVSCMPTCRSECPRGHCSAQTARHGAEWEFADLRDADLEKLQPTLKDCRPRVSDGKKFAGVNNYGEPLDQLSIEFKHGIGLREIVRIAGTRFWPFGR